MNKIYAMLATAVTCLMITPAPSNASTSCEGFPTIKGICYNMPLEEKKATLEESGLVCEEQSHFYFEGTLCMSEENDEGIRIYENSSIEFHCSYLNLCDYTLEEATNALEEASVTSGYIDVESSLLQNDALGEIYWSYFGCREEKDTSRVCVEYVDFYMFAGTTVYLLPPEPEKDKPSF